MHRTDQFIRVEEDGRRAPPIQTVAQPKVTTTKPTARTGNTAKSLSNPTNFVAPTFRAFETVFKEPIYKIMEKIKREPFFVWPPKLLENPALRDGQLYCTYHRDMGHMTEYIDTDLSHAKSPFRETGIGGTSQPVYRHRPV